MRRSAAILLLSLLGSLGCQDGDVGPGAEPAPPTLPASSGVSFGSVREALQFLVACVERNDVEKLKSACVGRQGAAPSLAESPHVVDRLKEFHAEKDLLEFYGSKSFPTEGDTFTLGGHGEPFHHLHIGFVRKGQVWRLVDIRICR